MEKLPPEVVARVLAQDLDAADLLRVQHALGGNKTQLKRWRDVLTWRETWRNSNLSLPLPRDVAALACFTNKSTKDVESLLFYVERVRFHEYPSPDASPLYSVKRYLNLVEIDISRTRVNNGDLLDMLRSGLTSLRRLSLAGCYALTHADTTPERHTYCCNSNSNSNSNSNNSNSSVSSYKPILTRRFVQLGTSNSMGGLLSPLVSPAGVSFSAFPSDVSFDPVEPISPAATVHDISFMDTEPAVNNNEDNHQAEGEGEHNGNWNERDRAEEQLDVPLLTSIHNALPSLEHLDIAYTRVAGPYLVALRRTLANSASFPRLKILNVGCFMGQCDQQDWDQLLATINRRARLPPGKALVLENLGLTGNTVDAESLERHPPLVGSVDLRDCPHLTRAECLAAGANGAQVLTNALLEDYSEMSIRQYLDLIT